MADWGKTGNNTLCMELENIFIRAGKAIIARENVIAPAPLLNNNTAATVMRETII